jgi:hypothetical protein
MSGYTLNGNPWAGSFILEGSTDGTSWDVMVAKSANNTFLSQEGLSTAGGNISSGYNSTVFTNTNFSIYKPAGTYTAPNAVSMPTYSGILQQAFSKSCTVTISGGGWTSNSNEIEDFSVHCILANTNPPYWTPGTTIFNCFVTGYNNQNGNLSFNAIPNINGTCRFIVFVRSGLKTGELKAILRTTSDSQVEPNIIMTTGGISLWLDSNDPLGTGILPTDGNTVDTWKDKSGKGMDGIAMNVNNSTDTPGTGATFRANAKKGRGALEFNGRQMYSIPSMTMNKYTIFAVCFIQNSMYDSVSSSTGAATIISDRLPYNYRYLHIRTNTDNNSMTLMANTQNMSWGSSIPDKTWCQFRNVTNYWALITLSYNEVDGYRYCQSYINSIPYDLIKEYGAATTPWQGLYVGGTNRSGGTGRYDLLIGQIGELLVYNNSLTDSKRQTIEYELGQKWGLWPWNLSPMWNLGLWPYGGYKTGQYGDSNSGYAADNSYGVISNTAKHFAQEFGSKEDIANGQLMVWYGLGTGGTDPTNLCWSWGRKQLDMSMLYPKLYSDNFEHWGEFIAKPELQINVGQFDMINLLNNYNKSNWTATPRITDSTKPWAIRWGYKQSQKPTHVGFGSDGWPNNADARFTLTGFLDSSFSGGTLLLTLSGTTDGWYYNNKIQWTQLTTIGSFTHYEFRQTVGPYITSSIQVNLGIFSGVSDITGFGSVKKANLLVWLDGSDPLALGEEPIDGTDIFYWVDKSGNKRHSISYGEANYYRTKEHTQMFRDAAATGLTKGILRIPTTSMLGGRRPLHPRILSMVKDLSPTSYTFAILCKATPCKDGGQDVAIFSQWSYLYFGSVGGNFRVYNNYTDIANAYPTTLTLAGNNVPILNKWMFLCMTYSGTTIVPYANGTRLQAIQNKTQARQDTEMYNLSVFGHPDNVNDFARSGYGDIAEIGIYNTALNDTEISNLSTNLSQKFGITLDTII